MSWFKVDDKLHSHRKTLRAKNSAREVHRLAGLAAVGLWSLSGSWVSENLTDGFVPDYAAESIAGADTAELAGILVRAGFWVAAERDGEQGWQFHDYLAYNPSRVQVLAERAKNAARQERWRQKARERANGGSNGVTDASPDPLVMVYPTRPDPPLKGGGEEVLGDPLSSEEAKEKIRAITTAASRRTRPLDHSEVGTLTTDSG